MRKEKSVQQVAEVNKIQYFVYRVKHFYPILQGFF